MPISRGKQIALQSLFLEYANNDDGTAWETAEAIVALLGCDGEKTLRDEIAMGALTAYIGCDASGITFWKTPKERAETVSEAYQWADSVLEARKTVL